MVGLIVLFISSVAILVALFYIREKHVKTKSKKDLWWKIIEIATVFLITGLLANEIVQPLFSPRVSDIEINPLFIQSVSPDSNSKEMEYFAVFEVKYKVLTSIIGKNKEINLRIPGGARDEIEVIFNLQEKGPYYSIINLERMDKYHSSKNLSGELPIKLEANAYDIREIDVSFIIREKMDVMGRHMGVSNRFWWADTKIKPISSVRDIYAQSNRESVGYGLKQPSGTPFEFSVIKIENLAGIEIRGLRLSVYADTVCLEDLEITKISGKYILIELDPGEVKNLLLVTKKGGFDVSNYHHSVKFKGWEGSCVLYNEVYKNLLEDM